MAVLFDKQKSLALNSVDLSRKGSIDEEIVPLVQHINDHVNFFTTSSCSGRIIVFDDHIDEERPGLRVKKKGCKWLFTSHKVADAEQVIESLKEINGDAVFKFEPFVLHVQCRNTEYAQRTLCCAVASGFRNSGISLGNKGKIIVGVRSTHGLEAPLSKDGNLLVSMEFIKFLTKSANKKLEENFLRIQKFFENMKKIDSMENKLARRERKRKDKKSSGDTDNETVKGVKEGTRSDLGLDVTQYSLGNVGTTDSGTAKDSIARGSSKTVDDSDEDRSSGTPVNEDTSTSVGSDVLGEDRFSQSGQTSPHQDNMGKEDRTTREEASPRPMCQDKGGRTKEGQASPRPGCIDKEDRTTLKEASPRSKCQDKGGRTKEGQASPRPGCIDKEDRTTLEEASPHSKCQDKGDRTKEGQASPLPGCIDKEDRTTLEEASPRSKCRDDEDRITGGQASPHPECQDKANRTTRDIGKCFLTKDVT